MEEKFKMILDKNEDIKWCGNVNVSAYVKSNFFRIFLFGLFPPFALLMLGTPYSWLLLLLSVLKVIPLWIGIAHFIFTLIVITIYISILRKGAKNTYFCVTNKRVIKRSGAFTNDFEHYSLKNIGNVVVNGGIFDIKGDNPSADLIVIVKNYHTDTDGNSNPMSLRIPSLNNVYEAYKIVNELIEGNNENLRIKIEK